MSFGAYDPYAPPRHWEAPRPPPRRRWWLWALVAGGALAIGVVALMFWGLSLIQDDVAALLGKHEAAAAAMGTVHECSFDFGAMAKENRDDYFHYRCSGSKSSARAILHTEPTGSEGEEELVDGQLVLPDGKTIELRPTRR